jgi:beta-galactosidase
MFKRLLAVILTAAMLLPVMPAVQGLAAPAANIVSSGAAREEIDFNDDWQFFLATRAPTAAAGGFAAGGLQDAGGVTTAEVVEPAFDDSAWRTVDVPHDWSIEGPKVSSGSNNSQAYLQGGLGWYRKTFTLPAALEADHRIFIDFEGVYQNSVVYVNGSLIGNYPSGYTGFAYDITTKLIRDGATENVVVVKVQNMSPSGRWYTGSGIVRPVKLVVTGGEAWIQRNGLVYTTPALDETYSPGDSAELDVSASVSFGPTVANGRVKLKTTVKDETGAPVAPSAENTDVDCNPSGATTLSNQVTVPNVRLWSTEDPYRYTVETEVLYMPNGGSFSVVDSVSTKYGFRYFEIDPQEGFSCKFHFTLFSSGDRSSCTNSQEIFA